MLLRDAGSLEHVVVQLALTVRRVYHQEGDEEHPLIPALEVLQQLLGLVAVGGEVAGNYIHVIPCSDRLFLFFNLSPVQVGDFPLDRLDGADLIDGLDVQIDDLAALHIQEVRQHPVVQLRGHDLDEGGRAELLSHTEHAPVSELEGAGGNEVLGGQAGGGQPVPGKAEGLLAVHVEDGVEQPQAVRAAHGRGGNAQPLEVVEDVGLNALQPGLGGSDVLPVDAEGEILGLGEAVVALGQLVLQHIRVFLPHIVKAVLFQGNDDIPGEAVLGGGEVQEGQLEADGAVKVVEEVGPALENGGFVLVLA